MYEKFLLCINPSLVLVYEEKRIIFLYVSISGKNLRSLFGLLSEMQPKITLNHTEFRNLLPTKPSMDKKLSWIFLRIVAWTLVDKYNDF